jgi:CheY-like chemotaxis protein
MSGLEDTTVLLVDDDARNIYALSRQLTSSGMNVLTAENGAQSIDTLKDHPEIDIVLMDIMMPVMDGYEAMQKIREIPEYQELPIIAVTAKAMPEDRDKCIACGATDYASKPIDQEKLFTIMEQWTK